MFYFYHFLNDRKFIYLQKIKKNKNLIILKNAGKSLLVSNVRVLLCEKIRSLQTFCK